MVCCVLQYDREFKEFRLHSIMSEHKKTITAISWNPKDTDLLASASADNQVRAHSQQAKDGAKAKKIEEQAKKNKWQTSRKMFAFAFVFVWSEHSLRLNACYVEKSGQ